MLHLVHMPERSTLTGLFSLIPLVASMVATATVVSVTETVKEMMKIMIWNEFDIIAETLNVISKDTQFLQSFFANSLSLHWTQEQPKKRNVAFGHSNHMFTLEVAPVVTDVVACLHNKCSKFLILREAQSA